MDETESTNKKRQMSAETAAVTPKKQALDSGDASNGGTSDGPEKLTSLDGFHLKEVLRNDVSHRVAFLHAEYKQHAGENTTGVPSVLIVDKKPFSKTDLSDLLSDQSKLRLEMNNDVYSSFHLTPSASINEISAKIILPATQKHIDKYREQPVYLIRETADDYQNITLPHLESSQFSLQWVYNVLEHKAEADRIIFEDRDEESGFLLAPDYKWDAVNMDELYCSAIVRKHGIKSMRDLTNEHLPLLETLLSEAPRQLESHYGVRADRLRVYVHYPPSFYHLHVHLVHVQRDAPGQTVGKAVLLQDVIDNIKLASDYYQKKTMCYFLPDNDPLLKKYREAGKARPSV